MPKASVFVVCFLLSVASISADLASDFEDIANHLPIKEIKFITEKYVEMYPNYADLINNFDKLLNEFYKSPEGQNLMEYFNHRGIAFKSAIQSYYDVIKQKWIESNGPVEGDVPEISGKFHADLQKVISKSDIMTVVYEKMKSSSEFMNFVAATSDPKFGSLLYKAKDSKVFSVFHKSAEVRGFWNEVWNTLGVVAVGMVMFG